MMMALAQAAAVPAIPAGPSGIMTPAPGSTGAVATTTSGFVDGMKLWLTPGTAINYVSAIFSNVSAAFSGASLMPTLGVIAPPLILVAVLVGGGTYYSRRRR